MKKILKLFLEAVVEDIELDERLTKSQRLQKQVKNFGVELEWASSRDPYDTDYAAEIEKLVVDIFGDKYRVNGETGDGTKRAFTLTEDSSARLKAGAGDGRDPSSFIEDLAIDLQPEYSSLWYQARDEAESYYDKEDFEDEYEWEEATEEKTEEIRNDMMRDFLTDVAYHVESEFGSDVRYEFMQSISNYVSDYDDFDRRNIERELMEGLSAIEEAAVSEFPYGAELVSPRLAFEEGNIDRICDLFSDIGKLGSCHFHDEAGLHVHIGRLDGMDLIHYLRASLYMRQMGDVETFAGRDYNSWAQEDDFLDDLETLISMNKTDNNLRGKVELGRILDDIVGQRYRTTNYSNLNSSGTIEFRLGSSELADNPTALEQYFKLIKTAIDYGVQEDFIDFLGHRLYLDENGNWKITTEDGEVKMSSKKGGKISMQRFGKEGDPKIWKRFVKRFNENPRVRNKVRKIVDEIVGGRHSPLKRYVFGEDGEINRSFAVGRAYEDYINSGNDLRRLEKVIEYGEHYGGPGADAISKEMIFDKLKGSKSKVSEDIMSLFLESRWGEMKAWIDPTGEVFKGFENHIDFSTKRAKAKGWDESKVELLREGWVRVTLEYSNVGNSLYIEVDPDFKGRDLPKIKSILKSMWEGHGAPIGKVYIDNIDGTDHHRIDDMRGGKMPWDAVVRKFEDWGRGADSSRR